MVDRFEFEIDTTRPREQWMKEVEANLAASRRARPGLRDRLMTVRPDNRLADAPMVPVACRRCGASCAGAQEQLGSDQRAVDAHRRRRSAWSDARPRSLPATGSGCSSRAPRCGIRYRWPPGRVHCRSLTRLSASRTNAQAWAPPSTRISVPVMNEPSSEATIAMTEATELGSPRISFSRPCSSGVCFDHRPRS